MNLETMRFTMPSAIRNCINALDVEFRIRVSKLNSHDESLYLLWPNAHGQRPAPTPQNPKTPSRFVARVCWIGSLGIDLWKFPRGQTIEPFVRPTRLCED